MYGISMESDPKNWAMVSSSSGSKDIQGHPRRKSMVLPRFKTSLKAESTKAASAAFMSAMHLMMSLRAWKIEDADMFRNIQIMYRNIIYRYSFTHNVSVLVTPMYTNNDNNLTIVDQMCCRALRCLLCSLGCLLATVGQLGELRFTQLLHLRRWGLLLHLREADHLLGGTWWNSWGRVS